MIFKKTISLLILTAVLLNVFTFSMFGEERQESIDLLPIEELPTVIREEKIPLRGHLYRLDDGSELDTVRIYNSDGTVSVYKFAEDVKYIDDEGNVRDKTNNIYVDDNGNAVNRDNNIKYKLPSVLADGISVSFGEVSLKMTPKSEMAIDNIGYSIEEQKSRAYPQKIVYEGVFAPNDRVEYTPAYSGLKEDIILYERPETNTYSFTFLAENAVLEINGTFIDIIDSNGNSIGKIDTITVISANGQISGGKYTIEEVSREGQTSVYDVSLVLDDSFFDDPNTQYPVTVDPTINMNAYTGTVKNIVDATLYSNYSATTTGGSSYVTTGFVNNSYGIAGGIIKFPGLMNDPTFLMVPNAKLGNVYLEMYNVVTCTDTDVFAYQYTGSAGAWDENTVLSNCTQSCDYTIEALDYIMSGTQSDPYYTLFYLTDFMEDWKTSYSNSSINPKKCDKGLILVNDNNSSSDYRVRFASTESTLNKPSLEYTYTPATSFTINSYYSNLFKNRVGASNAYNYISDAVSFINTVYYNTFNVSFTSSSISNRTSLIDAGNHSYDVSCSNICGTNCSTTHHKNRYRYTNDIYSEYRSVNQISVAWDDANRSSLCYSTDATHNINACMADVAPCDASVSSSRGIIVPNKYYDGIATTCIYTMRYDTDSQYYPSNMKLILAHEIGHIMGINETYGNGADNDHLVGSWDWTCIMRSFNRQIAGSSFVTKVQNNQISPFCSYCQDLLSKSIYTRYFPASN